MSHDGFVAISVISSVMIAFIIMFNSQIVGINKEENETCYSVIGAISFNSVPFVVALLLIVPLINSLLDHYAAHDCAKFIPAVYLICKLATQIIMIINVHIDYDSEIGWDKNTCPNLQSLTLFWLIWNYINISITFIYFIIYIGIGWCECSYYDDYDFE